MTNFIANALAFGGAVSDAYTTPFPFRLGQLVADADGNQYRFCSAGEPIAPESVLVIDPSWGVTNLTSTSTRGLIGVAPDYAKLGQSANTPTMHSSYQWSSDNGLWVQVWGRAYIGIGASSSPSDAANGPTTAATSARIIFKQPTSVVTPLGTPIMASGGTGVFGTSGNVIIENMWVATDASLGTDVSGMVGTSGAVTDTVPSFHATSRVPVVFYNPYLKVVNSVTD